ncbi:MAG: branched-chain amino acid ABC transporter permease [Chlorobiaceae bacterium]|nr:branched-chain amino acid ABC transporter permease [Chlorobiaceae bacterium]NTV59776.1 branched-chain amino acid ABC transporter permease [Chlorobiaceae bacterium]
MNPELLAYAQMAVSGGLMGMAYALVAYGFQLTFAAGKAVNFGQGELVMLGAFIGLTLTGTGLPYWASISGAVAAGAALGWFVEKSAVRLALKQHNEGWILLTIILGLFAVSAAENIWGREDLPYPAPWDDGSIDIFGISVTWPELAVAGGALGVMLLVEIAKRYTMTGIAVQAVSADPDAAELCGIRSDAATSLSWAVSGAAAAFAGTIIAPVTTVGPTMAAALTLKAFSVAVVAGLDSAIGLVLTGIFLGSAENLAGFMLGSGWRETPGLVLLMLALALRPQGIFGKTIIRKV